MAEIKIVSATVRKAISETSSAAQAVNTSPHAGEVGRNQLQSLNGLLSSIHDLSQFTETYKTVLQDNLTNAQELVDTFEQTDEKLASGMMKS